MNKKNKINTKSVFKKNPEKDLKKDDLFKIKNLSKIDTKLISETDAKTDVKTDAKTDAKTDVKTASKTDVKIDVKTDAKTDVKTDVKTDAKTYVKTDVKTDVKTYVKTDVKTYVKTDANIDNILDTSFDDKFDSLLNTLFDETSINTPINTVNELFCENNYISNSEPISSDISFEKLEKLLIHRDNLIKFENFLTISSMLFSYYIKDKYMYPKSYDEQYHLLLSVLQIIESFFENKHIKNSVHSYIYLLNYNKFFSDIKEFRYDFYYLFCHKFFDGKITSFFDGTYGITIPLSDFRKNYLFSNAYSSIIDKFSERLKIYDGKNNDGISKKIFESHLGLLYNYQKILDPNNSYNILGKRKNINMNIYSKVNKKVNKNNIILDNYIRTKYIEISIDENKIEHIDNKYVQYNEKIIFNPIK